MNKLVDRNASDSFWRVFSYSECKYTSESKNRLQRLLGAFMSVFSVGSLLCYCSCVFRAVPDVHGAGLPCRQLHRLP